jgi:hypothetical protein
MARNDSETTNIRTYGQPPGYNSQAAWTRQLEHSNKQARNSMIHLRIQDLTFPTPSVQDFIRWTPNFEDNFV